MCWLGRCRKYPYPSVPETFPPPCNSPLGQVYWITDKTPHESVPLKEKTMRQFFRIVTSEVSFWFRDHSTPNPLGVLPDPEITKTVTGDKFSEEGVEIVRDITFRQKTEATETSL